MGLSPVMMRRSSAKKRIMLKPTPIARSPEAADAACTAGAAAAATTATATTTAAYLRRNIVVLALCVNEEPEHTFDVEELLDDGVPEGKACET